MDTVLAVKDNLFGDEEKFTGSQGFNVAVALSGFDEEQDYLLDPSIGEIKFYFSEWDVYNNGTVYS